LSRGGLVAGLALAAALAFVFAAQVPDPGFERGHRGWVSAHTLSIAQKASAANGFVGYAAELATAESRELHYFDRYPVFFSAGLNAAWTLLGLDTAARVVFARQLMNLIYALTVLCAVGLLVELGVGVEVAVAAAAFAAASVTMVEYRDMVHFDQPALLGSVALTWAIAAWYRSGRTSIVLAATAVAVSSGRGYASFVVLGLWWLLDSAQTLRGLPWRSTLRTLLLGVPARACVLGVAIAAACLAYNVAVEARVRDVPWSEAGILQSATRRLSLDPAFNERTERRRSWPHFLVYQLESFSRSVSPWLHSSRRGERHDLRIAGGAVAAAFAIGFAVTRSGPCAVPILLMLLSGPLWLLLMRNVAVFHPYLGMYLLPAALLSFAALLRRIPRRFAIVPALAACALLAFCSARRNHELLRESHIAAREARDMQRVAGMLRPGDAIAEQRSFRGAPYALGFYLPQQAIQVEGQARFLLTRNRALNAPNLTPDNYDLFLYRPARYRATSPLARFHSGSLLARFGPLQGPLRRRR